MKLVNLKEFKGKIVLKSGLHIGAGDAEMRIGGTDNPVIKHPHTLEPYIPGSSLKGKVRSLLEMRSGLMLMTEGKTVSLKTLKKLEELQGKEKEKADCKKILMLFGAGGDSKEENPMGPTRVSFSDCSLNGDWKESNRGFALTEVKSENTINRIKGTAEHPRSVERVPADVEFDFRVKLKIFDDDKLEDFLFEGLKLLEMDALGGSGSRGYGRIEFKDSDQKEYEQFGGHKIREKLNKSNPL